MFSNIFIAVRKEVAFDNVQPSQKCAWVKQSVWHWWLVRRI